MERDAALIDASEVQRLLEQALARLMDLDLYLFVRDLHERTITHKLAEYLQPLFPDWNVDCEYNRDGHDPKRVYLLQGPAPAPDEGSNVFPDIIIHHRGDNDHNLLIIEAKKKRDLGGAIDDYDRRKIEAFSTDMHYHQGAALTFRTGDRDGDRIEYYFHSNAIWGGAIRVKALAGPEIGHVA